MLATILHLDAPGPSHGKLRRISCPWQTLKFFIWMPLVHLMVNCNKSYPYYILMEFTV